MPFSNKLALLSPLALAFLSSSTLFAGTLAVTGHEPGRNAGGVAPTSAITIHFNQPVSGATAHGGNFRAYGRQSGAVVGVYTLLDGGSTARLRPSRPFASGETVLVNLSEALAGADGSPFRTEGYAYQFSVAATGPGVRVFDDRPPISVRTLPGSGTRLYGAQATDLDLDGWLDLATMNEDTADLRVLMNLADGAGSFSPFLVPTEPIGLGASPNEPADFDNDGFPDVSVANGGEGTVSVLLGDGDGTFGPEQVISMGDGPHGIAALDVDGDADLDLVTANFVPGNLTLSLNDGNGIFSAASVLNSGSGWEWTVSSGDMDEDGIADLVVGNRTPNMIRILKGDGQGGFTFLAERASAGNSWMLVIADIDGDRHLDVSSANGSTANGAMLKGNGDGTLDAAVTVPIVGDAISTDLGDFDGDGDPDWILASFGGARWDFFTNDGAGNFAFDQRFFAAQAGSCALPLDFDNDGDLDVALFDELADTIILLENTGSAQRLFQDRFEQGDLSAWSAVAP